MLTVGPGRYVAMGNSYSSGQGTLSDGYELVPVDTNGEQQAPLSGVPGYNPSTGEGDDCDRSLTEAYPDVLAEQAEGDSWMPAQFNNADPIIGGQWSAELRLCCVQRRGRAGIGSLLPWGAVPAQRLVQLPRHLLHE